MDDVEFEIPRPMDNIVYESSSAWDQHVMEIDYDNSQALFLVLDTNFLLRHLSFLNALTTIVVDNAHLLPPLFFVLPGVVVDELDYQSKNGVRERAFAATRWLQEQIELRLRTGRGALRAQKEDETLRGGKSWRSLRGRGENDNIILDCCLYFLQLSGGQVRLLSQDRNLGLKATISDIPTMTVSKNMSAADFIKELVPGLRLDIPSECTDRSTTASRWAPPQAYGAPRVVVPEPSLHLASRDVLGDDDIDMEDMSMSYSPHPSSKPQPVYRRLADDPLENFIKNLKYNDVFSRAAGAVPYPESPRQTLLRISKAVPPHILHFVSERGESGYRAGGIRMWSRGDVTRSTSSLEKLFNAMVKWEDDQDEDTKAARLALERVAWDQLLFATRQAPKPSLFPTLTPLIMSRRQSIAVPSQSGNNKENGTRVAKIKRAQSIGGPMDAHKGGIVGADGLSPRRRKRRSMVPRKSILKMHNEEEEQTMEITQVVGGLGADMTMGRKSLARRVSFAAMAQVRMFEPTVNSNAAASSSSPAHSSPANPPVPEASTSKRSPAPTRRANSEEVGEASMELDDDSERSMEAGDSFGAEEEQFDGGEGGGEDSMELTDTYQIGTPSRRRSSAPMAPLPPLDRSVDRRDLSRASDMDEQTEELPKDKDKDSEEYMVKTGKSIVPRRKSEAWAELQSLTHAGSEPDDDSTASTMNSEFRGGFVPASQDSQSAPFSSQGTYSTLSSQQSTTDRDMGLDDALSRLRAARQSMGAGEADISIDDEDDNRSSSSGDFEGRFDDEDRTMDVTAVTGGLRFRGDDDEDEEAEGESAPTPSTAQQSMTPAPAFVFTEQPEASGAASNPASNAAPNLPTFAVEPPSPAAPEPQAPAEPAAAITFAIPSSPKPAAAGPSPPSVPAPTFAVEPAPGPSSLSAPSNPQPAPSPRARSPLTFEVSQSPVRPPPVSCSPRNAPGPFEFKLPSGSTPRRSSSAGGLNVTSTPARATTPVPTGTPKAVDAPTRATSAPPTPKRPLEEAEEQGAARKKQALAAPEPEKKGAAKPPRRRSFAPRMSMSVMGRAGRGAQDPAPVVEPSPPRVPSPPPAPVVEQPAPRPPSPVREPSPVPARASPPRPTTPPSTSRQRQAPASPKPAASLEEIRVASPLRSRVSAVGAKSPAQWRTGAQNELELDDVPAISASDFLKMTRISFMDGLTVKRRSTVGLGILGRRQSGENQPIPGVADYITAMTVGVPQLETFNYASKELKEYISNGKKAIRILEDDLDANNPYLFKEYLASGEDDRRAIEETLGGHKEAMRMRSKMSWYKWRHNFVTDMQAAADSQTELLQHDLESLRATANQLAEPIPSLREQHAKLKAQLAAERAAVEASKDCDPETMSELRTGITEQNTQIESYKSDIQSSTAKLEKLKAKLEEAENDKQALLNQMRVHQEQLDALHPTIEIVNLREEFDKLQRLHLWYAAKLEDKYIELVYDGRYRVQMKCNAFKPIPSGCRILAVPPKGKQVDQFPGLSELVLDLAQAMIRQTTELNLKKVVRMLGRLWTSVSHLRCNLRLLAMKYPITITRSDTGFGFKAIARVRFPGSKGLAKVAFVAGEQHIRDWGRQLHTLGVDVDVVFGKLDRSLLADVIKERIEDAVVEANYGLLLDACADAIACAQE